jgi:hypothetical protein
MISTDGNEGCLLILYSPHDLDAEGWNSGTQPVRTAVTVDLDVKAEHLDPSSFGRASRIGGTSGLGQTI